MDGGKLLLGLVGLGLVGAAALGSSSNASAATPPAPAPRPPAGGGAAPPPPPPPAAGGGAPPAPPPNPYGPGGGVAPPAPPPPPPAAGGSSGASTGGAQPIGGTYTPPGGTPQDVPTGGTAGASTTTGDTSDARYPRQDPRRLPSSITRTKILFSQGVLRGLGFQGLAMDGAWGPRTSDAVLAFQGAANRDHPAWNLTVDGVLGPRTLAALAWYFQRTSIGDRDTWTNRLVVGLDHATAVNVAAAALGAQPLQGLDDLGPARW